MPTLKALARTFLPAPVFRAGRGFWLSREARLLAARCAAQDSVTALVDEVMASPTFKPDQIKGEIVSLLEMMRQRAPRVIVEIGGRRGGSLALFSQVASQDAKILSVDLDYAPDRCASLPVFAQGRQRITCHAADSHSPATLGWVTQWLNGAAIDVLFIDGDHGYEGVQSDYNMYAPLVRPGGLVAFHDIVHDSALRTGSVTSSHVGGVPIFWRELVSRGDATFHEFVESWDQDGFGIGVIVQPGATPS